MNITNALYFDSIPNKSTLILIKRNILASGIGVYLHQCNSYGLDFVVRKMERVDKKYLQQLDQNQIILEFKRKKRKCTVYVNMVCDIKIYENSITLL
jgi:hypothetical protein